LHVILYKTEDYVRQNGEIFTPPSNPSSHFGNKLQALRGFYRMKQKEVAHLLGISQKTYSRLEQKEKPPNQDIQEKIREIFKGNTLVSGEITTSDLKNIGMLNESYNAITSVILEEIKPEIKIMLEKHIEVNNLQVEISIKITGLKNAK
jgi:transcriptional regulator with XRE-family HTH domain